MLYSIRFAITYLLAATVAFSSSSLLLGQDTNKTRSLLVDTETNAPQKAASSKAPIKSVSTSAEDEGGLRKVPRKEIKQNPQVEGGETYLMRYKFDQGVRLTSQVTHMATNYTKVSSSEQNSSSRTVSHKSWDFVKCENGEFTFEYRITDIDMSQRVGEGAEIRYSSKQEDEPMPQFKAAAESINKLISTVTIDEQGVIIARSDDKNPPNLGMGDITLPLPAEPVTIGSTWETPRELRIRREDGSLKLVKFRELFKLEKVSAGVATVSVRSEMITIISDPKEEAQVLQQLSNGSIKFDLDAGRMIAKNLEWDKRVVGFSGTGSVMEYSARLDEEVISAEIATPSPRTAAKK